MVPLSGCGSGHLTSVEGRVEGRVEGFASRLRVVGTAGLARESDRFRKNSKLMCSEVSQASS